MPTMVYRFHLRGLTDRVVCVRQLKQSVIREVQLSAARAAGTGDDVTFQTLQLLETAEALKHFLVAVSGMPVDLWSPIEKPEPVEDLAPAAQGPAERLYLSALEKYELNEAMRPKDDHELRDGRLILTKAGSDGLEHLNDGDLVKLDVQKLTMPGPLEIDELFDTREQSFLINAYRRLHGTPVALVEEMLSGKLHPVAMGA
jgi:hypothetical protein